MAWLHERVGRQASPLIGCIVNPPRLSVEVDIDGADDDASMVAARFVRTDEVPTVHRCDSTRVCDGEPKNLDIGHCLVRLAEVVKRDDVVPDATECKNNRERKVLVCENPRHCRSGRFVVADLSIDFVVMRAHVCPRLGEILGA
jgi:hypothetical protein